MNNSIKYVWMIIFILTASTVLAQASPEWQATRAEGARQVLTYALVIGVILFLSPPILIFVTWYFIDRKRWIMKGLRSIAILVLSFVVSGLILREGILFRSIELLTIVGIVSMLLFCGLVFGANYWYLRKEFFRKPVRHAGIITTVSFVSTLFLWLILLI